MAMIPCEQDQFKARLSCRVDWDILNTIKQCLNEENKKKFVESYFGQFWEIEPLKFQGQLYLHLLFRQEKIPSSKGKIVFHINDMQSEFGQKEFALITGLTFGPLSQRPTESIFHKEVFKGESFLTWVDIETEFKKCASKKRGGGEKTLKLALLLFLYGFLLANERKQKKINLDYMHLIDDLDNFNKFPWGRVAFEFLESEFRKAMKDRDINYKLRCKVKGEKHKEEKIDCLGFTHVMLVWAYEVMPVVADRCAVRISTRMDSIPRILRWSSTKAVPFDDLKKIVFHQIEEENGDDPDEGFVLLPNIDPSQEERDWEVYKNLVVWQEEVAKKREEKNRMLEEKKLKAAEEKKLKEEAGRKEKNKKKSKRGKRRGI